MYLVFVELADSSSELVALHSVKEELSNLFAAAFIFSCGCGLFFFLFLILVVDWAETVLRIPRLVFSFGVFSLDLPYTLLLERKRSPAIADDLGERTVISFDGPWNVLLTDKVRTEQHKRVRGTWYVT